MHELAARMVETFDVTVLCPHAVGAPVRERMDGVDVERYRYSPSRLEVLVNDGGIVTNLRRRRWTIILVPAFVVAQAWALWRLVRWTRPDVIHAHWLIPQGLLVATLAALGVRMPPFLVTSHGADLFALRGGPLQRLKQWVLRRASAVSVVSNAMRAEVEVLAPGVTVVVEPMGVDMTHRFSPAANVERSTNEILFVGRLVEKKGVTHLIESLPSVLAIHPDARLTIAGFGPEGPALRAQVQALRLDDVVTFLGAVPQQELPRLYRRAAVFVAPFVEAASGDREGLGLVSVEAAACGCPLVLSDLPAVRDVVQSAAGARLVKPGSAQELAQAINATLDAAADYRVRPDNSNLQSLRDRFDWTSVSARYAHILHTLVDSRPARDGLR